LGSRALNALNRRPGTIISEIARMTVGTSTPPWALLRPEAYSMIQIIKKNGPGLRFFGDDSAHTHLLSKFTALRSILLYASDTTDVPLAELMEPFILALKSPETNSSIVGGALGSISKLLRCNFFYRFESAEATVALRALLRAVSHCRYECPEVLGDEGVLHRMLDVLSLVVDRDGNFLVFHSTFN